jgi:hypothetical protein
MFFSYKGIPELAHIAPNERQLAWRKALRDFGLNNPWIARVPMLLCGVGAVLGWFLSPLVVAAIFRYKLGNISGILLTVALLCSVAGSCAGGIIGGFLGNQLLIGKIRTYLSKQSKNVKKH